MLYCSPHVSVVIAESRLRVTKNFGAIEVSRVGKWGGITPLMAPIIVTNLGGGTIAGSLVRTLARNHCTGVHGTPRFSEGSPALISRAMEGPRTKSQGDDVSHVHRGLRRNLPNISNFDKPAQDGVQSELDGLPERVMYGLEWQFQLTVGARREWEISDDGRAGVPRDPGSLAQWRLLYREAVRRNSRLLALLAGRSTDLQEH